MQMFDASANVLSTASSVSLIGLGLILLLIAAAAAHRIVARRNLSLLGDKMETETQNEATNEISI